MFQFTKAFCVYIREIIQKQRKQVCEISHNKKKQENKEDWKIAQKKCREYGEKLSDKNVLPRI